MFLSNFVLIVNFPLSTEEATSPEGGVKERSSLERGEREGADSPASPASRASPAPDERDDIEHSIPATLIQDPNAERWVYSDKFIANASRRFTWLLVFKTL